MMQKFKITKPMFAGAAAAAAFVALPFAAAEASAVTLQGPAPAHIIVKQDPGGSGCAPGGPCGSGGQNGGPGGGPGGQGCVAGVGCGSGGQFAGPGGVPGGCLAGVGCGHG